MQPDPSPILSVLSLTVPRSVCAGQTLHPTREKHGCGSMYLLGVGGRPPGIANRATSTFWSVSYAPADNDYLRTVTFCVNSDRLSVLCAGASYYHRAGDLPSVTAPFGSPVHRPGVKPRPVETVAPKDQVFSA